VARLYEAVITVAYKVPIDLYFANLPDPKQVAVTGLFDLEVLTGDLILVNIYLDDLLKFSDVFSDL
jgi:hypothetical protein